MLVSRVEHGNRPSDPMTGSDPTAPVPTEIKLHQASRLMELSFADGASFRLPYEFLRV
jgi:hypothetical protein